MAENHDIDADQSNISLISEILDNTQAIQDVDLNMNTIFVL